jgi:predicted XRE-type DNA-binding protein
MQRSKLAVLGAEIGTDEHKNADVEQLKSILAAEIIKALDREGLSLPGAQAHTGITAADFSRVRNVDLNRFPIDRLTSIVNRLGSCVDVKVKLRGKQPLEQRLLA